MNLVYGLVLGLWWVLHLCYGDEFWWLAVVNAFSLYLFFPLGPALIITLIARKRLLWLINLPFLVLFGWLYGELFLPRLPTKPAQDAPVVTVMSFNVLYSNGHGEALADVIAAQKADIVALHELTPEIADTLVDRLGEDYPYQIILARRGSAGLGVMSRYPLRDEGIVALQPWGEAAAHGMLVEVDGWLLRLLNVHAMPVPFSSITETIEYITWSFRKREAQIETLMRYLEGRHEPVIVVGDFNVTDQNAAYSYLTKHLTDAYRAAGWGFGHTFPAPPRRLWSLPVMFLPLRIDYIFHSPDMVALSAHVGPPDGSDHQPVVARLAFRAIKESISLTK
ncbi:MAG: endonuclease/exonuclease/phosphatase family protein [Anaerolineae bacterium]